MRYFLLDRITELVVGETATAIKNVTLSDEVLHDHFPDCPVFPGALLLEAMAQLGGFLLEISVNRPQRVRRALLAQIEQAKFHRIAEPGDQLLLRARLTERMDDAAKVDVVADVQGEKVASARVTFVLKEIDTEAIHQQRQRVYAIWTKHLKNAPEIL